MDGVCGTDDHSWNRKRKKKSQTSVKTGTSSVVRCKSLFQRHLKFYFPSPICNIEVDRTPRDEFPDEIEHKYPAGILETKSLNIVKGMRLEEDVVSLLSNGGKRDYLVRNNGVKVSVDSITGKYLLICCFPVPLPVYTIGAYYCRAMIAAYSHLAANNTNFEMVMVAKTMGVDKEEEEAAFNHFFSAFPCLAIPFCDTESRNSVCFSLGLLTHSQKDFHATLLLDPKQTVLQVHGRCFYFYGAAGFPYDDDRLSAFDGEYIELICRLDFFYRNLNSDRPQEITTPVSIVELLGNSVLQKSGGDKRSIYVSELSKKKCVGLYLCYDKEDMHWLKRIRRRCVARKQEFEIVLVYLPINGDSASFVKSVDLELEKLKISSWWVMPFQEEVSRRLWWVCECIIEDHLIVLADGGDSGEIYGKEFILELGDKHYPFTRKSLLDKTVSRLRSLTLESLLSLKGNYELHCHGNTVPVSELKGKCVLIYMDWYDDMFDMPEGTDDHLYRQMIKYWTRILSDYPGSLVVFVSLTSKITQPLTVGVPWLFLPASSRSATEASIRHRLLPLGKDQLYSRLIAFGDDGLIRSISAHNRLGTQDLFADTLEEDIIDDMHTCCRAALASLTYAGLGWVGFAFGGDGGKECNKDN